MKTFKIYGVSYTLEPTASAAPDEFAYKNEFVDDIPKGAKLAGFVTLTDGSIVQCYTKFNILVILIPLFIILACLGGGLFYLLNKQPKDVEIAGITIKEGVDNNIVQYNGFAALRNGAIAINFTNGDYPCTIQVVGEGITCQPMSVEPAQFVESIPVTYDTAEALVNAKLVIKTATSSQENEIVVEIPENNTANSPTEGLEGYWQGEYIYGDESAEQP